MTENTAWLILIAIGSVAGVFWMVTTAWFVKLVRETGPVAPHDPGDHLLDSTNKQKPCEISGTIEVKGRPEELAAALAAELGRHGLNGIPTRILSVEHATVLFEVLGSLNSTGGHGIPSGKASRGEVKFQAGKGGNSIADYRLATSASRWLLFAGGIFSVVGFLAIVVGFFMLSHYVVPDPRSGVRGQVVQMVQCVHFLWPPWLFGLIYKRVNEAPRQGLTTRIANLPFV